MASPTRTLTANFVGRTDNLEKAYKRVSKGSALMSDKLTKATRMAGVGFAGLASVAVGAAVALKPMIDKAADVEESLSKNEVVFGDSARAVEEFASTSLRSFGVTRNAALEATGVIGTLGKAMGITEADSADMATTLVGLAGDMSSFNNASVEETLTAIQSGLRGEAEPLRRFGVLLDAATLKAKALEKGIIKNTKEALTPQAKALAAYEVILEQTAVQMGDFERTSGSATNQQKLLAGSMEELATEIGATFLPVFTTLVTSLSEDVVPAVRDFFEDPSWAEGGRLAGRLSQAGFITAFTGEMTPETVEEAIRPSTWEGLAEKELWGATAARAVLNFFGGFKDGVTEERVADVREELVGAIGPLLTADFTHLGTELVDALKKGMEQGVQDIEWPDLAGTMYDSIVEGGGLFGIIEDPWGFFGIEEPGTGGAPPGSGHPASPPPAPEDGPPAPAPGDGPPGPDSGDGAPAASPSGSYSDFTIPSVSSGDDLDAFYESLGIMPSTPPPGSGHPAAPVSITVNGVVSGQEVVDAIGEHVDLNGPLPDWWTQ